MIEEKNILSLFDGMSCGQIALNRLGVKYDKYYASEIDKYAIAVTQANYPDTIQLGSVTEVQGGGATSDLVNAGRVTVPIVQLRWQKKGDVYCG